MRRINKKGGSKGENPSPSYVSGKQEVNDPGMIYD